MQMKPLAVVVHKALFPRPRPGDPASFSAHVNRNLVPETRVEVLNFYGSLDSIEAQYPGLDYSFAPHCRRLDRFPFHRKLFKAFRELKLSRAEILSLCQWEGTKSAKEKYERDVGRLIRDTTGDDIAPADELKPPFSTLRSETDHSAIDPADYDAGRELGDLDAEEFSLAEVVQETYNEPTPPFPRARHARPLSPDLSGPDERWTQWLREAADRNDTDVREMVEAIREGRPFRVSPSHVVDPRFSPPALTISNTSPPLTSNPTMFPSVSSHHDRTEPLNDTEVAMVNVWSLGNEIARSVNVGNPAIGAPSAVTTSTATTPAIAQPAGEAV